MAEHPIVPVPDPTVLTTAALRVAIDSLKELLESKIDCQTEAFNEKIKHNGLMDEKRHRETLLWFETREKHRLEAKEDGRTALLAAFDSRRELFNQQQKAYEEAALKLEISTGKQLEALAKEAALSRASLYDKIDTLKESITRGEGREEKGHEVKGTTQWAVSLLIVSGLALLSNAITLIYIFTQK